MTQNRRKIVKKISKIIGCIFLIAISLFLLIFVFYNYIFHPFMGDEKEKLFNYKEEFPIMQEDIDDFFMQYVDIYSYEEKYVTEFNYHYSYDSFCPALYFLFDMDRAESFSYKIVAGNDYDVLKEKLLLSTNVVDVFICPNEREPYFLNDFSIDQWQIKPIILDYGGVFGSDGQFLSPPTLCQWVCFNDSKREIIFSLTDTPSGALYAESENTLKKFLKQSIPFFKEE